VYIIIIIIIVVVIVYYMWISFTVVGRVGSLLTVYTRCKHLTLIKVVVLNDFTYPTV